MMVEGPKFRLWFDPGIDDEEWGEAAHAICKIILLGGHNRRSTAVKSPFGKLSRSSMARCRAAPRSSNAAIDPISRRAGAVSAIWKRFPSLA
jgi:hypothetical protein